MIQIEKYLGTHKKALIFWAFLASFGAYFCMYAFRKPFTASTYENTQVFGFGFKSLIIFAQLLGYMTSKFIGVKVISELKPQNRIKLIIVLILIAECSLVFFGFFPLKWKLLTLFMNGIPLGMVWGIIFSFLEGRRFTEIIATGLSVSAILSSGTLKTIGSSLLQYPGISDYWMPALVGVIFLPLFILFVWMLSKIPPPSPEDIQLKSKRSPMTNQDRKAVLRKYGLGIFALVITYAVLLTFRDFRDNFLVEIWKKIDSDSTSSIYSWTEIPITFLVIITTSLIVIFKSNGKALIYTFTLIIIGILLIYLSTVAFHEKRIGPETWMILNGFGLYMGYVPFQIILYERLIAFFRMESNAGFLMYLSDSAGYLGSAAILGIRELGNIQINWLSYFSTLIYVVTGISLVTLTVAILFFKYQRRKSSQKEAGNSIQLSEPLTI